MGPAGRVSFCCGVFILQQVQDERKGYPRDSRMSGVNTSQQNETRPPSPLPNTRQIVV